MIKKRMSAPYREVASRLKKLLATVKALLRELGEIARAELVEAITARTGRRTVRPKRRSRS